MHARVSNMDLICTSLVLMIFTCLLLLMQTNIDSYNRQVYISDVNVVHTEFLLNNIITSPEHRKPDSKESKYTDIKRQINKSILIYSTLFGLKHWPSLSLEEIKTFMGRCEYKHCNITYDKQAIASADAVLFHGVDVLSENVCSPLTLRNAAKEKKTGQKWVFFIQESPDNYHGFEKYNNLFDWVMSYKYTSDILVPYGHFKPLDESDNPIQKDTNYAKDKTNFGIWFASNCGRPRDKFIHELRRYIPISVGGNCAKQLFNESIKCDRGSEDCHTFIKSHKFFFAFENSFCDYYVSEKYWQRGIDWGLVPVVMGARYDKLNVIPGSYIDALMYPSIEQLANYLKYLDTNDEAYNTYFEWKKKYKRIGYEKMCQLCAALHTNSHSKPYRDVWSNEADCNPFEWKIDLIHKLVRDSRMNTSRS